MAELKPSKTIEKEQVEQAKKSGPSGATVNNMATADPDAHEAFS